MQARMLEELRLAEQAPQYVRDPESCERQARRLRALSAELRALDIRDSELLTAVEVYRAGVDGLAEAYLRVADAHSTSVDGGPDGGDPAGELVTLGARLMSHAAAMTQARLAVSRACGHP